MAETRKKSFLFVDDNSEFLSTVKEIFSALAQDTWGIQTAASHAEALEILSQNRPDVVVLDVDMPVMDGLQFLQLLGRTHPGQQVVMLTGKASEETRRRALESGATLFFEKPLDPDGYRSIYAALDALAKAPQGSGFQGMMRRVGLQEVLQIECLGRKCSVLEIFAPRIRGRIYVQDGAIVHAETGNLSGEIALYSLLALQGGGFNLLPYGEPAVRTIDGHWEFLLMEAARLVDEGAVPSPETYCESQPPEGVANQPAVAKESPTRARTTDSESTPAASGPAVAEVLLCSGGGEVLHAWECESVDERRRFIASVEMGAREMSAIAPVGRFDQLTMVEGRTRSVCQVRVDRHLFVRGIDVSGVL